MLITSGGLPPSVRRSATPPSSAQPAPSPIVPVVPLRSFAAPRLTLCAWQERSPLFWLLSLPIELSAQGSSSYELTATSEQIKLENASKRHIVRNPISGVRHVVAGKLETARFKFTTRKIQVTRPTVVASTAGNALRGGGRIMAHDDGVVSRELGDSFSGAPFPSVPLVPAAILATRPESDPTLFVFQSA
jgi:hypothetical protein